MNQHAIPPALGGVLRYWYLVLLVLAVSGGFLYWWRYSAFFDTGYMPAQPIPYSHKLHAGTYQIPCQYCHFNAARGKHAGIPPLSVCLGCHDPAMGAVGAGKPAVEKMLALIDQAQPGYLDTDDLDGKGEGVVKEGNVVHWNRIHLLPDHAYFSHEWHVQAGVSCQTCHGPIEQMEVVYQYADLSMGWCLDCHRSNDYTTLATNRVGEHESWDGSSEAFRVGVANYDAVRTRVRPDDVVTFVERHTTGGHEEVGDDHGEDTQPAPQEVVGPERQPIAGALRGLFDESVDTAPPGSEAAQQAEYWTRTRQQQLDKLLATYPDLPRWRVADLPESHRAFYGEELLMNAPTQCSTCHQ